MNTHYIAGLIDGEGWIGIRKIGSGSDKRRHWARDYWYNPSIKVSQSEKGKVLIDLLHEEFGGFISKRGRAGITGNSADAYEWSITGVKRILPILKRLRNKLILKQKQADVVIDFCENKEKRYMPRTSDKEFARREKLYQSIRELNKKGPAETK